MRTDISDDRFSWIRRLDCKKVIVTVFLLRLILASAYDIFVTITDRDILLPDSRFYSMKGRYVDLLLQGYDINSFTKDLLGNSRYDNAVFAEILRTEEGHTPLSINESNIFSYIAGIIYFIFGYSAVWLRVFNISISILSVYLLFRVAKRLFGYPAANVFLIIALFLPTQFGYSITLSRDFLRVLALSAVIWIIYDMGDIWVRRLRWRS